MNTPVIWTFVHLLFLAIGLSVCYGQNGDPNNPEKQPGYDYQGPKTYDYSDYNAAAVETNYCYSCFFTYHKGHKQGLENCDDPFFKTNIPSVPCPGACGKIVRILNGEKEYSINRQCVPNCKDTSDETGSIECCTTKLCNGAVSTASLVTLFTGTLIPVLVLCLQRLHNLDILR